MVQVPKGAMFEIKGCLKYSLTYLTFFTTFYGTIQIMRANLKQEQSLKKQQSIFCAYRLNTRVNGYIGDITFLKVAIIKFDFSLFGHSNLMTREVLALCVHCTQKKSW